jgi:hypothetical protein
VGVGGACWATRNFSHLFALPAPCSLPLRFAVNPTTRRETLSLAAPFSLLCLLSLSLSLEPGWMAPAPFASLLRHVAVSFFSGCFALTSLGCFGILRTSRQGVNWGLGLVRP